MDNSQKSNTLVVCGKKDVGKTTALFDVINYLIDYFSKKWATIDGPYRWGRSRDYWIKIYYQGKTIGINTRGDSRYWIIEGLTQLGKCDYYICASHLFGETVGTFLEKQDEYGMKNIIFLNKVGFRGDSCGNKQVSEDDANKLKEDNFNFKEQVINIFLNSVYTEK